MRLDGGFQEFYEANYGRIVAIATAVLGDRHEAEDVAQEAFARALTRWSRLGDYDLPEAWVRQVALRIAIDSGRRLRRSIRAVATLAAQRRSPGPEPGDSLAHTRLGTALSRLPMREREVVVLHYLADLPVDAISGAGGDLIAWLCQIIPTPAALLGGTSPPRRARGSIVQVKGLGENTYRWSPRPRARHEQQAPFTLQVLGVRQRES